MNLLVNREDLQRLKDIYGLKSDAEAARKAHALAMLAHEALRLSEWSAARGGPIDVYHRLDGAVPSRPNGQRMSLLTSTRNRT